jgi:hypothetical protein
MQPVKFKVTCVRVKEPVTAFGDTKTRYIADPKRVMLEDQGRAGVLMTALMPLPPGIAVFVRIPEANIVSIEFAPA